TFHVGGDLRLAVQLIDETDCLRHGADGDLTLRAQRKLAAGDPWMSHLTADLHHFSLPAPADSPDGDPIGREPPVQGDPVELLPAPERIHAERVEPARDIEIPGRGPSRDIGALYIDDQGALRHADRGVAILDPYAPDADTDRPDREMPGQRKDVDAGAFRLRRRHVQAEISGDGGNRELAAPQARDVDAHVDGRRVEEHAVRRHAR